MRKTKTLLVVGLIISFIFIGIVIALRLPFQKPTEMPIAVDGVIDLRGVDLKNTGPIRLDGDWLYKSESTQKVVKVPGSLENESYGIYQLTILLDDNHLQDQFGLKTTSIRMAHQLEIDDKHLGSSGVPSSDVKNVIRGNIPYTTYFYDVDEDRVLTLEIEVSTTGYPYSGIVQPIYFGLANDISRLSYKLILLEAVSIITLLMTALYFFTIYIFIRLFIRSEKSLLYFSGYCLFFAVFLGFYNEKVYFYLFPFVEFDVGVRILNVSLSLAFSFIVLYINSIESQLFPKPLKQIFLFLYGAYSLCAIFAPYDLFISMQGMLMLLGVSNNLLLVFFLSRALHDRIYGSLDRQGIYMLLFGALFILVNLISSILYNMSLLNSYITPLFTIYMFVILMAVFIARRYALVYKTSEKLTESLVLADRYKDEFLIQTSHELKTPLHGIINITEDIISREDSLSPRQLEDLQYVKSIAVRLSSLINDIIDFQNIKVNNLATRISTFDVHAVIKPVVEVLERIFSEKNIEVIIKFTPNQYFVRTDEQRLRQIVYNLVGNAYKFTNQGQIHLGAHVEGQNLILRVMDTGVGIDDVTMKGLFDGLDHLNNQGTNQIASKGLGLTVARRLARYLGGDVWLESTVVGQGSIFNISIPLADEMGSEQTIEFEEAFMAIDVETSHVNYTHTVLLIDDEMTNLKVLQRLFDHSGYKLLYAYNAEQAQQLLQEKKDIDIVLLDVMMPGISGFEMCQWIRERYTPIELPIILLTVKGAIEDIALGFEVGADDYLIKPFNGKELEARVKTQLQRKVSFNKAIVAELAFLQAQIKPHFIFNALSTISSLSTRDPKKTEALILDLADFLRSTFDVDATTSLTHLKRELAMVKAYLAIEQARFPKRLDVEYDVDINSDCTLPVLCLQPLVENALKHGVLKKQEGGKVTISVKDETRYTRISINDTGVGMAEDVVARLLSEESRQGHVGVINVHSRLMKLYGKGLVIKSELNVGTQVSFEVPKS